ncbi:hypothetical protein ACH42_02615 [Endozoicomonas sp. (ex Bugula neritina AB1)]|nr:hypothetical protein ACH42_02615 [Endozoicomonas sp. (ex Bugula neritina AB1)]
MTSLFLLIFFVDFLCAGDLFSIKKMTISRPNQEITIVAVYENVDVDSNSVSAPAFKFTLRLPDCLNINSAMTVKALDTTRVYNILVIQHNGGNLIYRLVFSLTEGLGLQRDHYSQIVGSYNSRSLLIQEGQSCYQYVITSHFSRLSELCDP